MAASLLWLAGWTLEGLILWRAWRCGIFRRYPLFCAYLAIVLVSSASLWPVYNYYHGFYKSFFWVQQFLSLLAGFGVLFEIVQKSFEEYPGARALATGVVIALFVILFGYFVHRVAPVPLARVAQSLPDLDRDFRAMQAVTLGGVLALILYFRIDVGRNLRGIIAGLGFYVGSLILSETLRGYGGPAFDALWKVVHPYAYLVALLIWTFALWSYAPGPLPDTPVETHAEYEALATRTRKALEKMRAAVKKAKKP